MYRKLLSAIAGAAVLAVVVFLAGVWYFVLRDDAPMPVSLEAALTAVAKEPERFEGSSNPIGTWLLDGDGLSFAGYRVDENLVGFGSKTAVGRSTALQGSLAYDGNSIFNLRVNVDLTALKSDQSLRDDTLKMQALQSCQFPSATFQLSSPITVGSPPVVGVTVTKTVKGKLTLHGVTRDIAIDMQGRLINGQVVVVGSTKIAFADYDIAAPRSLYVVSLDDNGILEFQLVFSRVEKTTVFSRIEAPRSATPTPAPVQGCGRGPSPGGPSSGGGGLGGLPPGDAPSPGFDPPPLPTPGPVPAAVGW